VRNKIKDFRISYFNGTCTGLVNASALLESADSGVFLQYFKLHLSNIKLSFPVILPFNLPEH